MLYKQILKQDGKLTDIQYLIKILFISKQYTNT